MNKLVEKRLLQATVALGCLVPIGGGLVGVLYGAGMPGRFADVSADVSQDSHFRYLSGLLLGIGLGFVSAIPRIETQVPLTTLLSAIVVVGGLARLSGVLVHGWPAPTMMFALSMELGVVPLLLLWQRRVARQWIG